ncbi:MAG: hypothetical protein LBJ71_03725, partial [Holosporaceae bacterium]|nr:hypothetical protein [Holosporaceae bacterium]
LQNKGYADAASVKGNIVKKDINRFAGTTVLGAGKVFDNSIYLGGEVLVDFCKTRKSDLEVHIGGTTTTIGTVKNSGIIPSLALRTGWVNNDCLFFVKLGAALPYTTYDSSTSSNFFKMSKASCRIGLGFEKFLGKKFSGRLEGEYAVGHKKARTLNGINLESKAGIGFNIRALVAYNIKS